MRRLAPILLVACAEPAAGPPRGPEASGLAVWYRDHGRNAEALTCAFDGDDLEELADTYASLGMSDAELDVRFRILSDDPATLFNVAAALRDRGEDTRWLFAEVVAETPTWDALFPLALRVLAEDCDAFNAEIQETQWLAPERPESAEAAAPPRSAPSRSP